MAPDQTGPPHEAREALAPTAHSRVRHFGVDARHARGAAACLMDQADLRNQMLVSLGTRRAPRAAALAPRPLAARGDTQHPAKSDDGLAGLLALHKLVGDERSALVSCAGDAPRLCSGSRAPRARSGSRAAVGATPPARRSSARRSVCPRRDPPA